MNVLSRGLTEKGMGILKKDDLLDLNQLKERGWGSRLTIWRRVDRGELPQPFSFGNAHNSKKYWHKQKIEALEVEKGISLGNEDE